MMHSCAILDQALTPNIFCKLFDVFNLLLPNASVGQFAAELKQQVETGKRANEQMTDGEKERICLAHA